MTTEQTANLAYLPLANPEFSDIRTEKMIYVDKTKLIAKIALQRTPIFLARPRRFGKSLLINTLHALFETGLKYFHGLDIEKIWHDHTYQVIHLDFSGMAENNAEELKRALGDTLIIAFHVKGRVNLYDDAGIREPSRILNEILQELPNKSLVLLVDEYDAPLTHHLDQEDELNDLIKILNNFYSTIKQYTGKFRLIFITGVTRASHISIFSAFNNLKDISLSNDFNDLLGFTQQDLKQYFDVYIENAANVLNTTKENVYQKIKQHYDGFRFSLKSEYTLYNPWSILSFLESPQDGLKNYWFDSAGTPALIMNYLKINNSFDFLDYNSRSICVDIHDISNKYEINNIPRNILLYQAGYFSIQDENDGTVRLLIPNIEIEESLLLLYLKENNLRPSQGLRQKMTTLANEIDSKNIINIINIFNLILNECVSSSSIIFNDERSVRDIIYAALLKIPNLEKIKERETVQGKSDLELITKKTYMVIEFKRTYPQRNKEASLQAAVKQVQENRYGLLFSPSQTLYRVCLVISSEEKKILTTCYKEIV